MNISTIMDETINLHLGDMSQGTLLLLKADLQKYSHLKLYESIYDKVCKALAHLKMLEGVTTARVSLKGDE